MQKCIAIVRSLEYNKHYSVIYGRVYYGIYVRKGSC